MKKKIALLMACVMAFGVAVGGTLAWLTDNTAPVVNTFTDSDINITLEESVDTDKNRAESFQMIPGHTIVKNPKVKVETGSEDCWLFVKITESTDPDLDAYISYAIADQYDATKNPCGWQIVQTENANGETIIGRKVYKDDTTKEFGVIGYMDGTTFVADKVLVKDTVNKDMMDAIDGTDETNPTLKFQAAAVQLFKQNSNGDKANTEDEFTAEVALAKVVWPTT